MTRCIYICFNCAACQRVVDYIKANHIDCSVINVQTEKAITHNLVIFPALFINDKLKAYGQDILSYL